MEDVGQLVALATSKEDAGRDNSVPWALPTP